MAEPEIRRAIVVNREASLPAEPQARRAIPVSQAAIDAEMLAAAEATVAQVAPAEGPTVEARTPATAGTVQGIPSEVMASIRIKAENEWPDDFTMQRYEIKQQVRAYRFLAEYQPAGIPPDVFNRIRAKAENEWPDDYTMQRYETKQQVQAYLALHE